MYILLNYFGQKCVNYWCGFYELEGKWFKITNFPMVLRCFYVQNNSWGIPILELIVGKVLEMWMRWLYWVDSPSSWQIHWSKNINPWISHFIFFSKNMLNEKYKWELFQLWTKHACSLFLSILVSIFPSNPPILFWRIFH